MQKKVISELDKVVAYISDKMEMPVSKAYVILLNRCQFDMAWAIVWMILGALFIIGIIIGIIKVRKYWKTIYDNDFELIATSVLFFISVLGIPLFFC